MKLNEIIDVVSDVTGIDLRANNRKRNVIYARVIYFKIARDITKYSLSAIGKEVGKDHATVLFHLEKNFEVIQRFEPDFYNAYLVAKDIVYKKVIDKPEKKVSLSVEGEIEKHYIEVNEELTNEVSALKEYIKGLDLSQSDERVAKYISRVPDKNMSEFLERLNNLTNYMAKQ